jgi:hypothetical protein
MDTPEGKAAFKAAMEKADVVAAMAMATAADSSRY